MNSRLAELNLRKNRLIAQCAHERNRLAESYRQLQVPVTIGTFLVLIARLLKTHREILVGISGLLAGGRPGKFLRVAERVLMFRPLICWLGHRWTKRKIPN